MAITPESLEAMLLSTREPAQRILAHVRAVVIDEVHAFVGDDRGAHLVSLLERTTRIAAGYRLAQRGVDVYLSHSSLALSVRAAAEHAFQEGSNCVIVATSALELGIDVGDLDHVIQIDAPNSVSSFLQRMGRIGRRVGTTANCTFLTTDSESLLRAAAIIDLFRQGYVEPARPKTWSPQVARSERHRSRRRRVPSGEGAAQPELRAGWPALVDHRCRLERRHVLGRAC